MRREDRVPAKRRKRGSIASEDLDNWQEAMDNFTSETKLFGGDIFAVHFKDGGTFSSRFAVFVGAERICLICWNGFPGDLFEHFCWSKIECFSGFV